MNQQFAYWYLLDFLYVITMGLSLGFLLMTTLTDPGIIPRGQKDAMLTPLDLGIHIRPQNDNEQQLLSNAVNEE